MLCLLLTCVNYSDFLSSSLKYNINNFDKIYIVTTPEDIETNRTIQSLNNQNNIVIIYSDIFFKDGPWGKSHFNKGGAINFGLSNMTHQDWILIGDADIIYPPNLKQEIISLDTDSIYGMYRYKVLSYTDLDEAIKSYYEPNEYSKYLHNAVNQYGRKKGIVGYCQLFNFQTRFFHGKNISYPEGSSCKAVDTIFSRGNFPRRNRRLLDKYCLHLGATCVNWKGRITEKWN